MTLSLLLDAPGSPAPITPRRGMAPALFAATVTGLFVTAGFLVARLSLPETETPVHLAESYLEAAYRGDAYSAWDLMCAADRTRAGSAAYLADGLSYVNDALALPSQVDVELQSVRRGIDVDEAALELRFTLTSDEPDRDQWSESAQVWVVREGGEFRACPGLGHP